MKYKQILIYAYFLHMIPNNIMIRILMKYNVPKLNCIVTLPVPSRGPVKLIISENGNLSFLDWKTRKHKTKELNLSK